MQRQIMRAPTEENVAMVNKLILCPEDWPQIHPSIRPLAPSAVVWIIFFHSDMGWKRPTEDLTEVIH